MKAVFSTLLAVFVFFGVTAGASAKPSMAFGYLTNKSTDANFNYLETIFPNSFASSLMNIFDIDVIKPHAVSEILAKHNMSLKKEYEPSELSELTQKIRTDVFIYGDFIPLSNNRIKIVLNYYKAGSNKLFTFTNVGRMETEIFKLVDRITQILINYMDRSSTYRIKEIKAGSKLAIISNLDLNDLNLLYIPFMIKGYFISGLQGNTLHNIIDEEMINRFQFMYTRENSFDIITDRGNVIFMTGTWAGEKYAETTVKKKDIYKKYDVEFEATKENLLDRLIKVYNGNVEYLLIVGFNSHKNNVWVRCIDIKSKDLIWMQDNIGGNTVPDISNKIIEEMSGSPSLKSATKEKSK